MWQFADLLAARCTCSDEARWKGTARAGMAEARCDVPKFSGDSHTIIIAIAWFEIRSVAVTVRTADCPAGCCLMASARISGRSCAAIAVVTTNLASVRCAREWPNAEHSRSTRARQFHTGRDQRRCICELRASGNDFSTRNRSSDVLGQICWCRHASSFRGKCAASNVTGDK